MNNYSRIFGYIDDGEIQICSLTKEHIDDVKSVINRAYLMHECRCIATGINRSEKARKEMLLMVEEIAMEGLSIIARDVQTNKIVGHVLNKIQKSPELGELSYYEAFLKDKCQTDETKELLDLIINVNSMMDLYLCNDTDCLVEIMFLGVLPEYRNKFIAKTLCDYSIQLAEEICFGENIDILPLKYQNCRPDAVCAIFSSKYSKRIGDSFGFLRHEEIFYDQYEYNGKTYQELINNPIHTSMTLVSKRL